MMTLVGWSLVALVSFSPSASPSPRSSPGTATTTASAVGEVKETEKFITVKAAFAPSKEKQLNDLLAAGEAALAKCKAKSSTYEETFLAWDHLCGEIETIGGFASWDFNTSIDGGTREQGEKLDKLVNKVIARLYTLKFPYGVLKEAYERLESSLTEERRAYAADVLRGFEHNGVHLEGEKKDRVKAIDLELIEIGTRFGKALKDSEVLLPVTPAQAKVINKKNLKTDPKTGGPVAILRENSYLEIMRLHPDRDLREKAFRAYYQGTADQAADLNQMRQLRREKSKLVKDTTYATLEMEDEGFTLAQVRGTLEEIKKRTQTSFAAVMQDYQKLNNGTPPKTYDLAYLEETAPSDGVNPDELLKYFTVENAVKSLLGLSKELYGLEFHRSSFDAKNRIETYDVADRDGHPIGTVTLDLIPRSNKYSHAACWCMRGRARRYPNRKAAVGLAANLSERSLAGGGHGISLDEVTTVFHEFGHVLDDLLIDAEMLGAHSVPRSLVEVPSQVFETWVLDPDVLDKLAVHYQTGKTLPQSLRQVLYRRSQRFSARHVRTQTLYALFDLDFHEKTDKSAQEIWDELTVELFGKDFFPAGVPWFTRFGHLDGYGAKYWGYKFADLGKAQIYLDLVHDFPDLTSRKVGAKLEAKLLVFGGLRKLPQVAKDFTGIHLTALPYVLETLTPYPELRAKIASGAKAGKTFQASLEDAYRDLIEKKKDLPSPTSSSPSPSPSPSLSPSTSSSPTPSASPSHRRRHRRRYDPDDD